MVRADKLYEGKSKAVFATNQKDLVIIEHKNTATAFDGAKKEELVDKGRICAAISNLIFEHLTKCGITTHFVKELSGTEILAKKVEVIPVEVIVRNVAAGGFAKKYGVDEGCELNNITFEFCIKSDILRDPMINQCQLTALGIVTRKELDTMLEVSGKINTLLIKLFCKAGIRLVDFKLEFGRYKGDVILCDEISPDSCRLWDSTTGKKLDKDRFRRDLGKVMDAYQEVLDRLKTALLGNGGTEKL